VSGAVRVERDRGGPREELLEGDAGFEAGDGCADAEVHSFAERVMRGRATGIGRGRVLEGADTRWRHHLPARSVANDQIDRPPGGDISRRVASRTIRSILDDTSHTVPDDGSTASSSGTLGDRHGVGKDTVARIWRARNLRPWCTDTFKLSNDADRRVGSGIANVFPETTTFASGSMSAQRG